MEQAYQNRVLEMAGAAAKSVGQAENVAGIVSAIKVGMHLALNTSSGCFRLGTEWMRHMNENARLFIVCRLTGDEYITYSTKTLLCTWVLGTIGQWTISLHSTIHVLL